MRNSLNTRALQRAVELYGGVRTLAARLNVSRVRIDVWLRGDAPMPEEIFTAIVDLLLEHGLQALTKGNSGVERAAQFGRNPNGPKSPLR